MGTLHVYKDKVGDAQLDVVYYNFSLVVLTYLLFNPCMLDPASSIAGREEESLSEAMEEINSFCSSLLAKNPN